MKKLAVVIGRFQPVHTMHVETLLRHASENYDSVLVLLGSSHRARDHKNPLRWKDRADLIWLAMDELGVPNYHTMFEPIKDYPYSNPRWIFQVQKLVDERLAYLEQIRSRGDDEWEPVLVGVDKDDTTFYLKFFPQWEKDIISPPKGTTTQSATDLRVALFEERWNELAELTTPKVVESLKLWLETSEGERIQEEYNAWKRNKMVLAFKDDNGELREAPYAPTFHTVDSVVTWRGHVLLIRRRAAPGKGLWALPGGFLNANEWIKAGAVRERQEESKVRFYSRGTKKRLRLHEDWCRDQHVFDHPGRSLRGRTITTGFHWVIPDEYEVEIEAADDADRAQWFPLYEALHVMDYELFEDHQSIIAHFAL